MNEYTYQLKSTGSSSSKYGVCEVCNEHVSEVFHQVEKKDFFSIVTNKIEQQYIQDLFGHEKCLIGRQRKSGQSGQSG